MWDLGRSGCGFLLCARGEDPGDVTGEFCLSVHFRTFANRFIIKDSSRSSSSSKSSIGIPKGSMMLQHLDPSSLGSKGSTMMGSVPFISQRQNGQPWPSDSCQAVRQEVHIRCPQGSILTSLSFSAQILQSWKVEPISQYNSYCSCVTFI